MKDGEYIVTESIHVFSCTYGQLKIPKDKVIKIEYGRASVDGIGIPIELIIFCKEHLKPL